MVYQRLQRFSGDFVVSKKGFKAGVPFWMVEVPVTIWYANNIVTNVEERVLTMTIVVVDPSPANPKGIAIDSLVSTHRFSASKRG